MRFYFCHPAFLSGKPLPAVLAVAHHSAASGVPRRLPEMKCSC